jgi:hypothetical protein
MHLEGGSEVQQPQGYCEVKRTERMKSLRNARRGNTESQIYEIRGIKEMGETNK